MIVFIHGFNTIPNELDINWLNENFSDQKIIVADFEYTNIDKFNIALSDLTDQIKEIGLHNDDLLFVGKSLGCLICEYLAQKFQARCLLINPGIFPEDTLKKYALMPTLENFKTKIENRVDAGFIENLLQYKIEHRDSFCGMIYLGLHDDIIDINQVREFLKHNYKIEEFNGGHSVRLNDLKLLKENILYCQNFIAWISDCD